MFSNDIKIMLYVNDVAAASDFWQTIGFVERERAAVDGTVVVELSPTAESQTRIVLYDLGFIQQHSPEVAGNSPSLMFASEDIFALYKKMQDAHVTLGDLIKLEEEYVFNFADNEGNYFAVTGH